jgi:hypothetical protein
MHDENRKRNYECDKCEYRAYHNNRLTEHSKICTGKLTCSYGELKIMKYLDEFNIQFKFDESYGLLKGDKGYLRFDFIINTPTNSVIFIEFNGRHHYEPIPYGSSRSIEQAIIKFKKTKKYDKIKDDYCKKNNYPLLWIHYKEINNIDKLVSDFINNYYIEKTSDSEESSDESSEESDSEEI